VLIYALEGVITPLGITIPYKYIHSKLYEPFIDDYNANQVLMDPFLSTLYHKELNTFSLSLLLDVLPQYLEDLHDKRSDYLAKTLNINRSYAPISPYKPFHQRLKAPKGLYPIQQLNLFNVRYINSLHVLNYRMNPKEDNQDFSLLKTQHQYTPLLPKEHSYAHLHTIFKLQKKLLNYLLPRYTLIAPKDFETYATPLTPQPYPIIPHNQPLVS